MAPRIAQFFPYATCKIASIGGFVCGLIHYATDVTVRKCSHVWLMRSVEYSLESVLVGKVPPTE